MPAKKLFPPAIVLFCAGCVLSALSFYTGIFFLASLFFSFLFLFFGKEYKLFAVLSLSLALGCFYPRVRESLANKGFVRPSTDVIVIEGKVASYPENFPGSSRFILNSPDYPGVKITANGNNDIDFGNKVRLECDYRGAGTNLICGNVVVTDDKCSGMICHLFKFRRNLSEKISGMLSPSSSALALGLIFGDRSGFTDSFKENLFVSGTTHIVALSGFNITVIIVFIGYFLFFVPYKIRGPALIIGVFLFISVVGPSASVIRAAIMGSLAVFGKRVGRVVDVKGPVAFSAGAMVLYDPSVVVDAGFILSFSALFGILFLSPLVKKIIFKNKRTGFAGQILIECLSAQFAAMPAIVLLFGTNNWLSFAPNVMIIWTVPFAMAFSFLAGTLSLAFGELIAFPFFMAAEALLSYEIAIINIFARVM